MSDLRSLLTVAADNADATSADALVGEDLRRGRRALHRRTARRVGLRTGVAALVAAGVAAAMSPQDLARPQDRPAAADPVRSSASDPLALVAYDGTEPAGFEIAVIPDGWTVGTSDSASFTLVPPGGSVPEPENAEQAMAGPSLEGQIYVSLAREVPDPLVGKELTVAGRPGVLMDNFGPSDTRTLYLPGTDEASLAIQVWSGLPLTESQLVRFAEGVTVTEDAQPTAG
jgi:hypothetical protein